MAGATDDDVREKLSIPTFFRNKNIFITGVTGFIGKVLLEKLLRSCPDIGLCYVLVRPKKGLKPEERVRDIFSCKLFGKLKAMQTGVESKVVAVCGDILAPNFGMSAEDQHRVCENTSVVFHSAATVKFDEELKLSVQMNVVGVQHLTSLCRRMTQLQALVHVSTAYANCDRENVGEQVYDPPLHPRKLIDAVEWMDAETMDALTSKLIGSRPNTYTYTKAMAETLLLEESRGLPVAIVRPSIVGASWEEPLPGWVDNLNGPTGLLVAIGKGLLRCMHGDFHGTADLIPVDIVTNAIIAVAWHTAVHSPSSTLVFNCTTGQMNRLTWGQVERMSYEYFVKNPCNSVARIPNPRFTLSNMWKVISMTFDHLLPAYVMDACLRLVGRRPMFVKIQDRLWKAVSTMEFFTSRQWNFSNDNIYMLLNKLTPEDRKMFPFDPRCIDWARYMENYCMGTKQFVLKEDISELPRARIALQRLRRTQQVLKVVALVLLWRLLVRRVPACQAVWNLLLSWLVRVFSYVPMLMQSYK